MCAPGWKESLRLLRRHLPLGKGGYPPGYWLSVILPQGEGVFHPSVCFADTSPDRGGFFGTSRTTFPTVNLYFAKRADDIRPYGWCGGFC